jgi:hypothetical protein
MAEVIKIVEGAGKPKYFLSFPNVVIGNPGRGN